VQSVFQLQLTHQYVGAGDAAELQVLDGSLLELHVGVAELAVGAQDLLDRGLHFGKQVDELDVGRQQQRPSRHGAQVELGVEEVELDQRAELKGGGGEREKQQHSDFGHGLPRALPWYIKLLLLGSMWLNMAPCFVVRQHIDVSSISLNCLFHLNL